MTVINIRDCKDDFEGRKIFQDLLKYSNIGVWILEILNHNTQFQPNKLNVMYNYGLYTLRNGEDTPIAIREATRMAQECHTIFPSGEAYIDVNIAKSTLYIKFDLNEGLPF